MSNVLAASGPAQTVLVIDDDEIYRMMTEACLVEAGFRVVCAGCGDAGLEILRRQGADIVLLDVMMPGRDGFSICEEIKADPVLGRTPVVMLTGSDELGAVDRAFSAHADDFITKAVPWSLLPRRVRFVLRNIKNIEGMRLALIAAQLADKAKSEFLAAMGHELRTPLNAIIGFADILADRPAAEIGAERCAEYAGLIRQGGKNLLALINRVLDWAKLQAASLELDLAPHSLGSLLEDWRENLQRECERGGHAFVMDIEAGLGCVDADPRRMKQILDDLLSNAVKFTPRGGRIAVVARRGAAGGVAIDVIDNGKGMTQQDVALAFQPFRQVDGRLSRGHEGAGLGLPLAKALTELHGGTLVLQSTPQSGTTVTLNFPAAVPAAAGARGTLG